MLLCLMGRLDNYADLVNKILKADTAAVQPLSPEEIEIIRRLSEKFKQQRDALDASHDEPEWKKIEKKLGRRISYRIAFKLTGIA